MLDSPKEFDAEAMCKDIAKGDKAAEEFCLLFVNFAHWIDDAADADREWSVEDMTRLNLAVVMVFTFNSFWQKHKSALLPLIVSGSKAWLDSLDWVKRESVLDKVAAGVLKTAYAETLFYVAYLTGGWDHFDAMTKRYRAYTYD